MRLWDLRTGHLLEVFQGHSNSVYSVSFSPDGLSIVSGSLDRTCRIWDLSPATLSALAAPVSDSVTTVVTTTPRHVFKGHGDFVLSVGYPGNMGTLGRVDQHGRPIPDEALNTEWVISGSKDRQVLFWDAATKTPSATTPSEDSSCVLTLQGHKNSGMLFII